MKKWMRAFGIFLLFVPMCVHAGVIFFDNFQQFTDGTVLTQTNYDPAVGASVNISSNSDSEGTVVVATNFSGSTQALFEPGAVPYQESYEGFPAEAQTDQVVTLSFTLWIPTLRTTNHFGGFGVNLLTSGTNNNNDVPFVFFGDGGRVVVFTNTPSIGPILDLPFVQIGSWSALQVMTNVLVLNYPAGTFSFSINGAVLTNMAIPGFFTNVFDAVRVQAFEGITNASVASLSNSFALGDVQLSVPASSTNQDISQYIAAAKGQFFDQLTSGAPTLSSTGFAFMTQVKGTGSNTVLSATDQIPGGSNIVLSLSDPESSKFKFQTLFTSKPVMDAVFTNGVYLMTIGTADQGTLTPSETLPGDDYPNTPRLLNFDAAQAINASTNFDFVWGSFTNGTTNDSISFEIDDAFGNTITNTPDLGDPGALDGTVTNFLIPGGTLAPGTTNTAFLQFIKLTTRDTNSVPGALGVTGYFEQSQFSVVAAGTTVCVFAISPTNATFTATGGSGGVTVTAQNGCAWTATNNDSFITITSGSSGSGNGIVNYSVAANTNFTVLIGTMTIAGQTFTVNQAAAPCGVLLDSNSANFGSAGGSSNVNVTANTTNCTWTATSNNAFITLTGGTNGIGNGTVSYSVTANTNTLIRTGTISIGDQTLTVTQGATACNVAPATTNATFAAAGGSSNVVVTANGTNCTWTAASNNSFITITSGTNGVGSGTVNYIVAANTNTIAQTGTMTIAGQTFTVIQAAAACTFTLSSTNATFASTGGSSNVTVMANGTNCAWTAVSNNGFITITAGTNGTGNGTVNYTVAINTNTTPVNGTMTIASRTFTVTQAGRPLASDLAITDSAAPDPVLLDSNVTYTLVVTNGGPDTAVSVTVTDELPRGVTFISATPRTVRRLGTMIIDNLGSLSAGASTTLTVLVRAPRTAGVLTNTATVSSSTQDPDATNNTNSAISTVIVPPSADLAVFKTSDAGTNILVGSSFTYTVVVTNFGPDAAPTVKLVDPLETNRVGFVSLNNGNCINSNGVVVCNFGTISSGAGAAVSIVVTAAAPGQVSNTATVTGAVADKVKTNNSSTVRTFIDAHDLAATKLTAPKTIKLTEIHTNQVGKVTVTIQNRSTEAESITDTNTFTNLVTLAVSSVGPNDCTTPVPVPTIPKRFPIVLKPKQTLTVVYSLTYGCPNAPIIWTNVYQYVATVHLDALPGGVADMYPADDVCPRAPLGIVPDPDGKIRDLGCGARGTNGVVGAAVLTTVIKN